MNVFSLLFFFYIENSASKLYCPRAAGSELGAHCLHKSRERDSGTKRVTIKCLNI